MRGKVGGPEFEIGPAAHETRSAAAPSGDFRIHNSRGPSPKQSRPRRETGHLIATPKTGLCSLHEHTKTLE